jgi:hypothetical protein
LNPEPQKQYRAPNGNDVSGRGQLAGKGTGEDALKPLEGRRRHPAQTKLVDNCKTAYRQNYQYFAGGLLMDLRTRAIRISDNELIPVHMFIPNYAALRNLIWLMLSVMT